MIFSAKKAIIISDLHVGLPYFKRSEFLKFLSCLPDNVPLILNGDTIDTPKQHLSLADNNVLDALKDEAEKRKVIWICGNHDVDYVMPDPGKIVFTTHVVLNNNIMITHGDDFENIMSRTLLFLRMFKFMHNVRIFLGANPVHVAYFAKKWLPFVYRILTEEVKKNAVLCAKENQFDMITCGHVHYTEDSLCEGVRYINTGTWTEEPLPYIEVNEDKVELKTFKL